MTVAAHVVPTSTVPRLACWCPGTHPACPACGGRLMISVDRGQQMRGSCRNRTEGKQCPQHYVAVGIGGDVTVVLAVSAVEYHDLIAGRKIAGVSPETVQWAGSR